MEITHEVLIALGFIEVQGRPQRYAYKAFTGRLESGVFYFHGFSPAVSNLADLKYMQMLIDYNEQTSTDPYPSYNNLN